MRANNIKKEKFKSELENFFLEILMTPLVGIISIKNI